MHPIYSINWFSVKKYIDEKAGEGLSKASHKEADFMASLLSEPTMTKRDVYTSAVELMAGSVDTVALKFIEFCFM